MVEINFWLWLNISTIYIFVAKWRFDDFLVFVLSDIGFRLEGGLLDLTWGSWVPVEINYFLFLYIYLIPINVFLGLLVISVRRIFFSYLNVIFFNFVFSKLKGGKDYWKSIFSSQYLVFWNKEEPKFCVFPYETASLWCLDF